MLKRGEEKAPPAIGGIYVAAITPRREREVEVDLGAMLELVDFLGSYPIDGLAVFGTTGEFVHYTVGERSRYVALLAKRSRVPVMANVSHSTLDGALRLGEEAAGAGIGAVLLMPPHYFRYPAAAVESFCLEFATYVARWVPVYLSNSPSFVDGLPITTMERLMSTSLFAGIVDSSAEWISMEALLRMREARPFTMLAGDERVFVRARRAGADGGVTSAGCAVPELMLALERTIRSGDAGAAARLDARVGEFLRAIEPFPVPVGVKSALAARGVRSGPHATPLGTEMARELERFQAWFREWLPGVERECREVR